MCFGAVLCFLAADQCVVFDCVLGVCLLNRVFGYVLLCFCFSVCVYVLCLLYCVF